MNDTEFDAGFGGQDITYETPPRRHRRRWPWVAAGAAGSAGVMTAALLMTGGGTAPVNLACQRATAAQNAYVDWAVADGYPDLPIGQGMAIIAADLTLLTNMQKADCPGNTVIRTLPG